MAFFEKLKSSRTEHPLKKVFKGYTYGQIAYALGLHPMTISNALNGWSVSEETETKLYELASEIKGEALSV